MRRITVLLGVVCAASSVLIATVPAGAAGASLPPRSIVLTATKRAADYYRPIYPVTAVLPRNGWSWSTYFAGDLALHQRTNLVRFRTDVRAWGDGNGWAVNTTERDPDTVLALQTYYDLHAIDPTVPLDGADAVMAHDLTDLPAAQYDWVDAVFMGLPTWARWAARTGSSAYLTKMDAFFRYERDTAATSTRCSGRTVPQDGLWNAAEGLWYRDCTFVGKLDPAGYPIFWSRGNGWAIAAMARVLAALPAGSPRGTKYRAILTAMAASLARLQGTDGLWRSSLLDPARYPAPESSGTALITYALAWGIKAGVLSRSTYLPVVVRAWDGLTRLALQPSGFVSRCQGPGGAPGTSFQKGAPTTPATGTSSGSVDTDSPPFCVGAFLLAGTAVAQLAPSG